MTRLEILATAQTPDTLNVMQGLAGTAMSGDGCARNLNSRVAGCRPVNLLVMRREEKRSNGRGLLPCM